jgi:hypothetical protein
MNPQAERARKMLPSIVITVLSMMQALALELYWNRFLDSEFLWQGGWDAVIGWLQMGVMLVGILQIWVLYVSLVLRFSWLPTMEDTLIPFAIGLLEFSMIFLIGPTTLGPWFLALAALFAICTGATHAVFIRARKEPANAYFFSKIPVAGWRDFAISSLIIGTLVLFSVALWITDNRSSLPLVGLIFGLTALAYQFLLTHRYWMNTLLQDDPAE